jgi:hypothetical protein
MFFEDMHRLNKVLDDFIYVYAELSNWTLAGGMVHGGAVHWPEDEIRQQH